MTNKLNLPENSEVEKYCPNQAHPAVKLVVKTNRKTGYQFLGCPLWPYCAHTENIPEEIKMRASGHPTLPGF